MRAPYCYVYFALRRINMGQTKKDPIIMVGENLKRAIKNSKWKTQAKFAENFGTDERNVGRWCNNGIDKLSTILQIADFLEIDVSALLPF